MFRESVISGLFCLAICPLLISCAPGVVLGYQGEKKPLDEVAVFVCDVDEVKLIEVASLDPTNDFEESVFWLSILFPAFSGLEGDEFHLLPGKYKFGLEWLKSGGGYKSGINYVATQLRAGYVYNLLSVVEFEDRGLFSVEVPTVWNVSVVEAGTTAEYAEKHPEYDNSSGDWELLRNKK